MDIIFRNEYPWLKAFNQVILLLPINSVQNFKKDTQIFIKYRAQDLFKHMQCWHLAQNGDNHPFGAPTPVPGTWAMASHSAPAMSFIPPPSCHAGLCPSQLGLLGPDQEGHRTGPQPLELRWPHDCRSNRDGPGRRWKAHEEGVSQAVPRGQQICPAHTQVFSLVSPRYH